MDETQREISFWGQSQGLSGHNFLSESPIVHTVEPEAGGGEQHSYSVKQVINLLSIPFLQ